jgi:hypothetical protein
MSDPPWWQEMQARDRKERLAREHRLKARRAKEQADFEQRTSRQFAEFKELFGILEARAKEAAAARLGRQEEAKPWVFRRLEDLEAESLRSRLVTLIHRRRKDWREGDVAKWLAMCGLEGIDVEEILKRLRRKQPKMVWVSGKTEEPD